KLILPAKKLILLTKNFILLAKKLILLTKNFILLAKKLILLTKNFILLAKKLILPAKKPVFPSRSVGILKNYRRFRASLREFGGFFPCASCFTPHSANHGC
ncbi:MAG: hypothetical protein LBD13_05315, partial [Spirochaetaceae bacterium]|nr:hypothetical protein [Spirochaetaceae bacterium]